MVQIHPIGAPKTCDLIEPDYWLLTIFLCPVPSAGPYIKQLTPIFPLIQCWPNIWRWCRSNAALADSTDIRCWCTAQIGILFVSRYRQLSASYSSTPITSINHTRGVYFPSHMEKGLYHWALWVLVGPEHQPPARTLYAQNIRVQIPDVNRRHTH